MKKMIILLTLLSNLTFAKVDLVTLPTRDTVQLTIYNSADLTLVRDSRALTLKQGKNELQFSWAGTLIDPTSLEMLPLAQKDQIDIANLVFPPRVQNLGLWNIQSGVSGPVPVEITYFTSGLAWRAFYMGTLTADEKTMRLEGYVMVTNNSGEDYENAQTRLVVGQVHQLDQIADLAQRQYPYGRPGVAPPSTAQPMKGAMASGEIMMMFGEGKVAMNAKAQPKEIVKEGLSEYFLYTIEGQETIPTGWSKRLPSFNANEVPVVNLYKYEEERYGPQVIHFLSFKNDKAHKLGETPIPGGVLKAYRLAGEAGHLAYEGQSNFKYIPVDEDVELNLGPVANLIVEPKLMDYKTENYRFNNGNIYGWDEIKTYKIEVKNTREVTAKVEITRNFEHQYWKLEKAGDFGNYEKVDLDTAKFTLELPPRTVKTFTYTLTLFQGKRQEEASMAEVIGGGEQSFFRADGLICGSYLDGTGQPVFGNLQRQEGIYRAPDRKGQNEAVRFEGRGYIRYGVPYFPERSCSMVIWACPENPGRPKLSEIFCGWLRPADDPLRVVIDGDNLYARIEAGDMFGTKGVPVKWKEWVHIAAVKDRDRLTLYVNGKEADTTAVADKKFTQAQSICLGGIVNTGELNQAGDEFYLGLLDDFAFYARALSADEIQRIYRQGLHLEKPTAEAAGKNER